MWSTTRDSAAVGNNWLSDPAFSVERGLDEKILAETASTVFRPGEAYPDVRSALEAVCRHAGARDLVIVTGSIFLVADLLANVNVKELLLPRAMRKKIERNSNGQ